MIRQSKYLRSSAAFFVLMLLQLKLSGQVEKVKGIVRDTISGKENTSKHSLYGTAGYGSNMIYLGSTISNNLPYYSGAITYGYRNSFFITASASHLARTEPWLAFSSLSANYSHTFNSWFDISCNAATFLTERSLQDTFFSNFGFLSLTGGFDWKLLYTRVSVAGILSDDIKGYIQIANSRYFQTPGFFKGNAFISFNPDISILSGEIFKIETTTGIKKYGLSPPFRHYKKNPVTTTDKITSQFGLIDFEFSLPVTFNYKDVSIEAEPCYVLPAYKNPDYPAPKGFSAYLSIVLRFF